MSQSMPGWVTVNTDAGLLHQHQVGSYAYWIRGENFKLHGAGLFKELCSDTNECEAKAIINALHILKKAKIKGITKIIINRDNVNVKARANGNALEKQLHKLLFEIAEPEHEHPLYEFRHVKAHQKKNNSKRSWVNDWCDKACRHQLRKWKKDHLK